MLLYNVYRKFLAVPPVQNGNHLSAGVEERDYLVERIDKT